MGVERIINSQGPHFASSVTVRADGGIEVRTGELLTKAANMERAGGMIAVLQQEILSLRSQRDALLEAAISLNNGIKDWSNDSDGRHLSAYLIDHDLIRPFAAAIAQAKEKADE